MGRRKKKQKPLIFCYYCDREFENEKVLIQHQRAKHFKCIVCRKRLGSAHGMMIHVFQVHKQQIDGVPHAKQGRDSFEMNIFGMSGVPDEVLQQKRSERGEDDEPPPKKQKLNDGSALPTYGSSDNSGTDAATTFPTPTNDTFPTVSTTTPSAVPPTTNTNLTPLLGIRGATLTPTPNINVSIPTPLPMPTPMGTLGAGTGMAFGMPHIGMGLNMPLGMHMMGPAGIHRPFPGQPIPSMYGGPPNPVGGPGFPPYGMMSGGPFPPPMTIAPYGIPHPHHMNMEMPMQTETVFSSHLQQQRSLNQTPVVETNTITSNNNNIDNNNSNINTSNAPLLPGEEFIQTTKNADSSNVDQMSTKSKKKPLLIFDEVEVSMEEKRFQNPKYFYSPNAKLL